MQVFAPPPKLSIAEWADKYRILPPTSPEPGMWRTRRTPYLEEVMSAISDTNTRTVIMMFCSQVGKSEVLNNTIGYYIDYEPSPIMMIQPTIESAQQYSKERLQPMFEYSPRLREKICDNKSKTSESTILHKVFPGGFLVLVGANAPRGLASWSIRILLVDELDRFPLSAGTEGDPLSIALARQSNWHNAKTVIASTPTTTDESRILKEYEDSTQEVWCVPCPSCGAYQPYEWGRVMFPKSSDEVPMMVCAVCGCLHNEQQWKFGQGMWIAQNEHPTRRGFHLNALASPWQSWESLIELFRTANKNGVQMLQTFINTRLAEPFEEPGENIDESLFEKRTHYYNCDVPAQVNWLTCGVDVQHDRLELEVVGWGEGKESWGIHYKVIPGDPGAQETWDELDRFLQRTYVREDGLRLHIHATCIDTQFMTAMAQAFTKKRFARNVFAIRGEGGIGKPIVSAPRRVGKNKDVIQFGISTDTIKDIILYRLSRDEEGPDYCHYPRELTFSDGELRGYNEDYFRGLTSERRITKMAGGRVYSVWVNRGSYRRNEALDCRVYATAALEIRNPHDLKSSPDTMYIAEQRVRKKRQVLFEGVRL